MSRRKQGSKPQHRSELSREGVELDEASGRKAAMPPQPDLRNRDLLTCGQCGRSFLLRNILGFIEHKKSRCDRPSRLRDSRGGPRSPRAAAVAADLPAATEDGPTASVSEIAAEDDPTGDEMEPAYYICTSCKEPFSSAWFLLHHAQYTHGLHIYLELDDSDSLSAPRMGVSPSTSTERPPQPSPTSILDGSPFEGPRCPEPSFRGRSPAASALFTPPLRCPPDYSDSGSEEAGGTTASRHTPAERTFPLRVPGAAQKEMDFSRRLRRLAGDARRPFPPSASSPFLSAPSPPQAPHVGSARQRSPHGRSKECEFCGKSFKFPSNLVVHRRSHTGEKPYRCPFCDHACSQSSKLKRHMKTHMHHAALFNGWPPAERLVGGIKEEPPAVGYRHRAHSAAGRENGDWQDAEECGRPQGQSRGYSVHSVGSLLGEQEELGLKIKVLKEEPEDPQPGEQKGQSDCEGNGPLSDSEHFHTEEEFAIGESEGAAASPPMGLANGFGFHSKRPLGPPLGPSLLRAPHKPVKAEEDLLAEEASRNYYSRWLADCAASRQQPPLPPPVAATAARASPSSENSGENAGSRSSTPPRDISADSGTASGHSTPKRMGGAGRGGAGDGRRRNTCEFCGKVFRNASNLTVHRRSHTGERPYRCELCSYACTQSSKLTRHMKTHMQPGKEVFRCNSCNIPFSIYSTLEKHMKKRHSESLREPQLSN